MKQYPKDTPVTLEMLAEITNLGPTHERIKSMIEPTKQEPKEGEWWMCHHNTDCCDVPLLRQNGQWCGTTRGVAYASSEKVIPLYKMERAAE